MVSPPRTSSFDREEALRVLRTSHFDVVVIGGGVTGCGVALDAAARGLRTALVEAGDFAGGTSSMSSKLVHGGLRYLRQREYRLVYQALAERQRLLGNARHLVHPVPFLIPLFGRPSGPGAAQMTVAEGVAKAYSVALWTYDLTGGLRIGHRHRRVDAATAIAHFPALSTDRLVASFLYWDAQADDARLTLALARTAALAYGAAIANHSPVSALLRDPVTDRACGVRLVDSSEIHADAVVNAAGVWSAEVAALPGGRPLGIGLRPAKGVHLTVAADRLPCDQAAVFQVPGQPRSIFVVPWEAAAAPGPGGAGRYTYIGTTDTDYDGPLGDPHCSAADIADLLQTVNRWTTAELTAADVTGSWAGLRPLISGPAGSRTADLSRRHRVITSSNGVVTVAGGKLTTYRLMAADAVDQVMVVLGRQGCSTTAELRLWGSADAASLEALRADRHLGLNQAVRSHLVDRFGVEARVLAAMCRTEPDLRRPIVGGLPYLRAEVVFAARHEMAVTLEDVLSRRTRALILNRQATRLAARPVAELMAAELGWSPAEADRQVAALETRIDAEEAAAAATTPAGAGSW